MRIYKQIGKRYNLRWQLTLSGEPFTTELAANVSFEMYSSNSVFDLEYEFNETNSTFNFVIPEELQEVGESFLVANYIEDEERITTVDSIYIVFVNRTEEVLKHSCECGCKRNLEIDEIDLGTTLLEFGIKGDKGDKGEDAKINGSNTIEIDVTAPITMEQKGNKLTIGADVDLSDYYTKEEVDKKISEVEVDLSDYYTKEEVNEQHEQINKRIDDIGYVVVENEYVITKLITSLKVEEDYIKLND